MFELDKWDYRWLGEARLRATYSKDPSTQVGAVIADGKRHISFGYNGFPASCPDHQELLENRETKYKLVVHAELNAVLNAGSPVRGASLYTYPLPPCPQCSVLLAAAGISRVISLVDHSHSRTPRYLDTKDTEFILTTNGIPYRFINSNDQDN